MIRPIFLALSLSMGAQTGLAAECITQKGQFPAYAQDFAGDARRAGIGQRGLQASWDTCSSLRAIGCNMRSMPIATATPFRIARSMRWPRRRGCCGRTAGKRTSPSSRAPPTSKFFLFGTIAETINVRLLTRPPGWDARTAIDGHFKTSSGLTNYPHLVRFWPPKSQFDWLREKQGMRNL